MIEGLIEMKGWRKYWGLILAEDDHDPVMFKMTKPTKNPIHSLLCPQFVAIWYLNNEKIGEEIIKPGRFRIDPPGYFDTLIEIPIPESNKEMKGGDYDGI